MKTKLYLILVLLICITATIHAEVPQLLNYQGKLMQANGSPVTDGAYSIQFAIYDVPTSGTALWSETNASVQVKSGLFSALLGSKINLPTNLFSGASRFLATKVGTNAEMLPRQQITSVGYAFRAAVADTVADGAITTGKIAVKAVTGDKLADGTITADKIANESITINKISGSTFTLGYAEIKSDFMTSSGITQKIPGLSVTAYISEGERRVKITLGNGCLFTRYISHYAVVTIWDGEVNTGICISNSAFMGGAEHQEIPLCIITTYVPTPGSHTFNIGVSSIGGGDVGFDVRDFAPTFILVEAI